MVRRQSCCPRHGLFQIASDANQQILICKSRDELQTNRQVVSRLRQRQRNRWLSGDVEYPEKLEQGDIAVHKLGGAERGVGGRVEPMKLCRARQCGRQQQIDVLEQLANENAQFPAGFEDGADLGAR